MRTTKQRLVAYGLVNGLGLKGNPRERDRLIRSVGGAIQRRDWSRLISLAASYGIGAAVGTAVRRAWERQRQQLERLPRW